MGKINKYKNERSNLEKQLKQIAESNGINSGFYQNVYQEYKKYDIIIVAYNTIINAIDRFIKILNEDKYITIFDVETINKVISKYEKKLPYELKNEIMMKYGINSLTLSVDTKFGIKTTVDKNDPNFKEFMEEFRRNNFTTFFEENEESRTTEDEDPYFQDFMKQFKRNNFYTFSTNRISTATSKNSKVESVKEVKEVEEVKEQENSSNKKDVKPIESISPSYALCVIPGKEHAIDVPIEVKKIKQLKNLTKQITTFKNCDKLIWGGLASLALAWGVNLSKVPFIDSFTVANILTYGGAVATVSGLILKSEKEILKYYEYNNRINKMYNFYDDNGADLVLKKDLSDLLLEIEQDIILHNIVKKKLLLQARVLCKKVDKQLKKRDKTSKKKNESQLYNGIFMNINNALDEHIRKIKEDEDYYISIKSIASLYEQVDSEFYVYDKDNKNELKTILFSKVDFIAKHFNFDYKNVLKIKEYEKRTFKQVDKINVYGVSVAVQNEFNNLTHDISTDKSLPFKEKMLMLDYIANQIKNAKASYETLKGIRRA